MYLLFLQVSAAISQSVGGGWLARFRLAETDIMDKIVFFAQIAKGLKSNGSCWDSNCRKW
jgi:hypothetical protein